MEGLVSELRTQVKCLREDSMQVKSEFNSYNSVEGNNMDELVSLRDQLKMNIHRLSEIEELLAQDSLSDDELRKIIDLHNSIVLEYTNIQSLEDVDLTIQIRSEMFSVSQALNHVSEEIDTIAEYLEEIKQKRLQ